MYCRNHGNVFSRFRQATVPLRHAQDVSSLFQKNDAHITAKCGTRKPQMRDLYGSDWWLRSVVVQKYIPTHPLQQFHLRYCGMKAGSRAVAKFSKL
jgi:hypothetical protein